MNDDYPDPKVVDATLVVDSQSRKWAMFCHLSALIGIVFPPAFLIAPIVVWRMKKDVSSFVDQQGKEAVNFQISMMIAIAICFFVLRAFFGFFLVGILTILNVIWVIMAAMEVNEGKSFRYPVAIRLIN